MPEPTSAIGATIGAKWFFMLAGSAVGSAVSLVFVPAKNHKDASVRGVGSIALTVCVVPFTTRYLARHINAEVDSIPDLTLAVAAVVGLLSWSIFGGIAKAAAKHNDAIAEQGLAWFLKRTKPDDK